MDLEKAIPGGLTGLAWIWHYIIEPRGGLENPTPPRGKDGLDVTEGQLLTDWYQLDFPVDLKTGDVSSVVVYRRTMEAKDVIRRDSRAVSYRSSFTETRVGEYFTARDFVEGPEGHLWRRLLDERRDLIALAAPLLKAETSIAPHGISVETAVIEDGLFRGVDRVTLSVDPLTGAVTVSSDRCGEVLSDTPENLCGNLLLAEEVRRAVESVNRDLPDWGWEGHDVEDN